MSARDPKAVILDLFARVDAGDDDFVREFYAPDYVDHSPSVLRGGASALTALAEVFRGVRRAFPDTRHVLEDVVAEGDKVVVRVTAEGTHRGELYGIPPSGRRVVQRAITVYRVVDGRIAERWSIADAELRDLVREAAAGAAERDAPPA
jgi:steroid delta-isomerase-like uncharacterized protein